MSIKSLMQSLFELFNNLAKTGNARNTGSFLSTKSCFLKCQKST